jgi:hypothetical protein
VRAVGSIKDAEAEVERMAREVVIDLGILVEVDFVEAKVNRRGVPFGKERIDAFGIRFRALEGQLKFDKTYIQAADVTDDSAKAKERIREFLTKHYKGPRLRGE